MARATVPAVVEHVSTAAFGRPLVSNSLRSRVVEAMLHLALPQGWTWCGADWAGWDLEHADGARLEVKQSAARQTWAAPARPAPPVFDIRQRTGFWEGAAWTGRVGRHAHIYVFAHHPVADESADHRDPEQWVFHVLPTAALPESKTLSLARLRAFSAGVGIAEAAAAVEALRGARGA